MAMQLHRREALLVLGHEDVYGADHPWDLVLASEYSGAQLVGKWLEFVYLQATPGFLPGQTMSGRGSSPIAPVSKPWPCPILRWIGCPQRVGGVRRPSDPEPRTGACGCSPAGVQKKSASGMSSLRLAMNACNASSMAGSRPGSSQVSSRRFHCAFARRAASSPPSADHCS